MKSTTAGAVKTAPRCFSPPRDPGGFGSGRLTLSVVMSSFFHGGCARAAEAGAPTGALASFPVSRSGGAGPDPRAGLS